MGLLSAKELGLYPGLRANIRAPRAHVRVCPPLEALEGEEEEEEKGGGEGGEREWGREEEEEKKEKGGEEEEGEEEMGREEGEEEERQALGHPHVGWPY